MAARRCGVGSMLAGVDIACDASSRLPGVALYHQTVLNPLLISPRLIFRALDDLHAIAEAARDLPARMEAMDARLGRIEQQADEAIIVAQEIGVTANTAVTLGADVDKRMASLLTLGRQIDRRAAQVLELGERLDMRATELLTALPTLERAVGMATPLEGAVDRLGRLVDRLPGGRPLPPRDDVE